MDNQAELTAEGVTEEEIAAIRNGEIQMPVFPYMVFSAAVVKDIVDIASLATIGPLISLVSGPILFFYIWSKIDFVKKRLWKWLITTLVAELLPGLSFIPMNTILVLRAHATEYKQLKRVFNFIESFAK